MKTKYVEKITYKGCDGYRFDLDGREGTLVCPKQPRPDNAYIWRTEFLGAFDTVDMELVKRGWYLAYYKVSDLYGCPKSLRLMRQFQACLEDQFRLAPQAILFGFSRGGLYAVNYAADYPDKVSKLYLDAPALDICSWPGGRGSGIGAEPEWSDCKRCYGITGDDLLDFQDNPINKIQDLIDHQIPVVLVAGDADEVVPYDENGKVLYDEYCYQDGEIKLILKKGCGHHPHSLEDPAEIAAYLEENTNEETQSQANITA